VWRTFADVQQQEDQEDHVFVPRHCHVPRDEALVIGVGGANVRALEDDGAYAEGGSRPLKNGVVKLLDPDFDLCVVIDTDTMAAQCMNELFWHQAPAAVWRGTKTILEGKKTRRAIIRHTGRIRRSTPIGRH